MTIEPGFEIFTEHFAAGRPQVVWARMVADLETPVSAFLKLGFGKPNSFLLESVEGGAIRGRYSMIGMSPDLIWRSHGDEAEVNRAAETDGTAFAPCPVADADGTLASLRALIAESHIDLPEHLPPLCAGLFGYLGYDMVRLMERLPDSNPDELGIPEGMFVRPTVMAVFDSLEDVVTIVAPVWPTKETEPAAAAYDRARARIEAVIAALEKPTSHRSPALQALAPEPKSNMAREDFEKIVARAVEYIHAGDAFQIVPSQRFSAPFTLHPFALYRSLRRLNPSPFLFFLDFGDFSVVGSSPEILVRVRDGKVTIRPLAGTRRRGATPEEDRELERDLLSDPKERAEHLMLLDLGRNDVGRVAEIGSVSVTERFVIEYYSHVMHISSNVEGVLRPDVDALDALIAGFPAGTVSGAPKIRAMEIIDELEPVRRGIYAGAIGYFAANGWMDTCIALRTAVVKDNRMYVQAGGGVVADSEPGFEYEETRQKARALFRAAEEAVRFAASIDGTID